MQKRLSAKGRSAGLSTDAIDYLTLKYGGKCNAYRSAAKAGLSVYCIYKAFGVSRYNVWSKLYGWKETDRRRQRYEKFLSAPPMDKEDAALVQKQSGTKAGPMLQRRRRANPDALARITAQQRKGR